ncbi:Receptor-like protein 13 [Camellia lanceoleosa]|nr:Receptor-like protein 13 [Camellia lanceoleosa]
MGFYCLAPPPTKGNWQEFFILVGNQVVVQHIEERLSALGNCIACNDYIALTHTDLDKMHLEHSLLLDLKAGSLIHQGLLGDRHKAHSTSGIFSKPILPPGNSSNVSLSDIPNPHKNASCRSKPILSSSSSGFYILRAITSSMQHSSTTGFGSGLYIGTLVVANLEKRYFHRVLILVSGHSDGCLEGERGGLLEFKDFLKSNGVDADHLLPTWVDEKADQHGDCCDWERVTCDHTTGHMTELSLDSITDAYYDTIWFINASLFLPFKELRSLNLNYNLFSGWTHNEGFEKLSALRKLETLNLEWNEFDGSILPSLSALRSLKMLNLHANKIGGLFPPHELAYFGNLERLDLSYNQFNDIQVLHYFEKTVKFILVKLLKISSKELIIPQLPKLINQFIFSRLKKLETLYLGVNQFNNGIILCLSSLISLKNLSLYGNNLGDLFPARELVVLKNLETLDLSFTELSSLTMQDSKLLSNLSKMRHLDLSGNHFDKDAFRILGALPSLKFLSLESNRIEGPLSNQELTYNLSNLEVLLLKSNQLNGTLPMEGLTSFRRLETLDLSENNFFASIPPSIGALSSLKALSLAQNNLNGSLPIQGLCKLKKLEELDLSHNLFEGILPPCLSNLRSLKFFDISLNQFTGNLSPSLFGNLNSLEYIGLSHNRFEGLFSFRSFANNSNLEVLKVLVLSNCNLNKLSGDVPKFLLYQNKLMFVDLSHNNLTSSFPNWLLVNNTRLEHLILRNNSFVNLFFLPQYCYTGISRIDISDNHFSGQIQANIRDMFPYIQYINLSKNAFEGGIPSSFGKMSNLDVLDLSTNNFSGEVPNQLVRNCISLGALKLSNNNFRGQIFSVDFNLTHLWTLQLNDNQFTGPVTNVLSKLHELYFLDISNNYMSGKIPSSMGNMTSLRTLIMGNNSFNGEFPCALVPRVFMDISYNLFSGSILPSCSNPNLQYFEHIHLQGNKFTRLISRALLNSSFLLTLDIRDNIFFGSILDSIRLLSNLRILLFRGNQLSGSIPIQLCQLNWINLMNLSNNYFSGSIPPCFSNITFGTVGASDPAFMQGPIILFGEYETYQYGGLLKSKYVPNDEVLYDEADKVEFVTKSRSSSYKGNILNFMSGLDLSHNKLIGEIPFELGKLSSVRALNLSHNLLTGPIPKTFSNLAQIESLDLSYNNLSGNIPTELINLNFLEVFTVAHNNLSGKILGGKHNLGPLGDPVMRNPFLCGPPLEKNYAAIVDSPHLPTIVSLDESEEMV